MSDSKLRFLFAGGGTGGHLYPALAIAERLKKERPLAEILFVGTRGKIEARVVPEHGYAFRSIWISGIHRSFRPGNLVFPLKVVVSLVQSFFLIKEFRPSAVIGTGGYVCGPVLMAASWMGIPTFIHESNSYPGITTRLLAGRMTRVYLGFERARTWLKNVPHAEVTGTPTRESLGTASRAEGLRLFNLDPAKQTVLVMGGSQGAASINAAVAQSLESLEKASAQVLWQTGTAEFEKLRALARGRSIGWVGAFIDRMDLAYAAADLVVCRSGATTLAEITQLGKPAILVPYPHAAADHQTFNARTLADVGAAVLIHDRDAASTLRQAMLTLLSDPSRRLRMADACKALGKPDSTGEIAGKILALIGS